MANSSKRLKQLGITTTDILIPKDSIDQKKWAVIACDQFSSEPEYWNEVKEMVGDSPSTLKLIFPECYLDKGKDATIIDSINQTMKSYCQEEIFSLQKNVFILIERKFNNGKSRWGLMCALDLDHYDFSQSSKSLIRATEGTIMERIPPRLKIREKASLELPHIMVLVDDQAAPLIEPLKMQVKQLKPLYQTNLKDESGSITGYRIDSDTIIDSFAGNLEILADKEAFEKTYGNQNVLLFAIGDGNHSLATAKTQWNQIKSELKAQGNSDAIADHPGRYALVELNSIYDSGIEFEPIHRVLFNANGQQFLDDFKKKFDIQLTDVSDQDCKKLAQSLPDKQQFILLFGDLKKKVIINNPNTQLSAGTFQQYMDEWLMHNKETEIDYIHGVDSVLKMGSQDNNFGIILPNISKANFFATVIKDGSFPRKTFSMGEAHEKRFYYEARKIIK